MISQIFQFCATYNCMYCGLLGEKHLFYFRNMGYRAVSDKEIRESLKGENYEKGNT